ncbi:hypothetical protein OH491_22650 [Termitidicoccus mucosus]|uniref:Uncharacterized protein n=1 Tax=Termitidicoccus mucosus TaxID=1184151 RepID=A0A178IQB6_9BACT|nr:hypothetical protein AW736_03825 [Opitutaceae bacterium TSB47]
MSIAVCTLFEGDYHIGAGALANSLHASGFRGVLWAGWRGALPPWAAAARDDASAPGARRLDVADGFAVVFIPVAPDAHLTYHKADFLDRVFNRLAPSADAAIYLDPDIVIKCPWTVFPAWLDDGLALVEDVNASMPARHPLRLAWTRLLAGRGLSPRRQLDRYYNAGFIGLPRARIGFLDTWRSTIGVVRDVNGALATLKNGDASALFHSADQDALNLALMLDDVPLNAAGPEAMDFAVGGHHLSHAVGTPKPWQARFVRRALDGYPPSTAAKSFHQHVSRPLEIIPPAALRRRRRSLAVAALIARFYRRA